MAKVQVGKPAGIFPRSSLLRRGAWAAVLLLFCGTSRAGFLPDNSFTDSARGLVAAQFLKVPPSARFSALGGTGLTLGGPESFFLNAAGPRGSYPAGGASASYEALLAGAARTSMAVSLPSKAGVFSAGLIYNSLSPGEKLDGAGSGDGSGFAACDSAFGAGWAGRLGSFDLGLNLKYIRSRLAEAEGSSAALDAGLVFREPSPSRTELALAVRNFGPPLKLGSEKAPLPLELGAGLRWKYNPVLNIFLEGRMPVDHAPYLAFAGEWFIPCAELSGLFLRSGLNLKNYEDHGFMGAFTGGFGLKLGGFTLDYAFVPYGELGAAHRMTAGLAWGAAPAARTSRREVRKGESLSVGAFTKGKGVTDAEASVVRNLVEAELARTGAFRLAERSKLDFILEEKKLAYAGLSAADTAAALARACGAQLAVFGAIARDGDGYLITAVLADAATSEIIARKTVKAGDDYLFRDASRRLASALASR